MRWFNAFDDFFQKNYKFCVTKLIIPQPIRLKSMQSLRRGKCRLFVPQPFPYSKPYVCECSCRAWCWDDPFERGMTQSPKATPTSMQSMSIHINLDFELISISISMYIEYVGDSPLNRGDD